MPHLFGWDTINPKVGGKERTEADQSHSGGVGGAAASVPVSSLLPWDLRALTTTGRRCTCPQFLHSSRAVRDLRHFRVTRKYRDGGVTWLQGRLEGGGEGGRLGKGGKKSIFWRWTRIVYPFLPF